MKKLLVLFALVAGVATMYAQQDNACETRLTELQQNLDATNTRLAALEQTIATLQTQVDEVTRQNLALKHAISLTPTIAEATAFENINVRLLSAVGDVNTGMVTLTFSVMNSSRRSAEVSVSAKPQIVTENGKIEYYKTLYIGDVKTSTATLNYDTPLEYKIEFQCDFEFQYAKSMTFELCNHSAAFKMDTLKFANIPIKWE